jgi:hypothetical protein
LPIVQAAQEEQVGDLFDDLERVGDAPGSEGIPQGRVVRKANALFHCDNDAGDVTAHGRQLYRVSIANP